MALDISKSVEIIEIMENYIESIRPEPAMRKQIDINVSVCLSTYFLIKKVFLALRQKDETGLHRK